MTEAEWKEADIITDSATRIFCRFVNSHQDANIDDLRSLGNVCVSVAVSIRMRAVVTVNALAEDREGDALDGDLDDLERPDGI